jgi:hypothetical protein
VSKCVCWVEQPASFRGFNGPKNRCVQAVCALLEDMDSVGFVTLESAT